MKRFFKKSPDVGMGCAMSVGRLAFFRVTSDVVMIGPPPAAARWRKVLTPPEVRREKAEASPLASAGRFGVASAPSCVGSWSR